MRYTQEQIDYIKQIAKGRDTFEITRLFNQKFNLEKKRSHIRCAMQNRGITNGVDKRYQKGRTDDNGYRFTKDDPRGMPYRFKKGNIPHTIKEVGEEVERPDGYMWVKIGKPNKWKQKHWILWEKHNPKVKLGEAIIFLDQNPKNITIENLVLVKRSELAVVNKNRLLSNDKELNQIGLLLAKTMCKHSEREKQL